MQLDSYVWVGFVYNNSLWYVCMYLHVGDVEYIGELMYQKHSSEQAYTGRSGERKWKNTHITISNDTVELLKINAFVEVYIYRWRLVCDTFTYPHISFQLSIVSSGNINNWPCPSTNFRPSLKNTDIFMDREAEPRGFPPYCPNHQRFNYSFFASQ